MFLSVLFSEIARLLGGAWLIFSHISGKSSFPQGNIALHRKFSPKLPTATL